MLFINLKRLIQKCNISRIEVEKSLMWIILKNEVYKKLLPFIGSSFL